MAETLDPNTVPPFPIYTLTLDADTETLELDGVRVEPSYGQGFQQAGIDAVIRKAETQGLDTVRVRVRSTTGEVWDMVVSTAGEVVDTTEKPQDTEPTPPKRHTKLLIGAGLGIAAVGLVSATVATVVVATAPEPPTWTTPGVGAQVPIALPEEFSTQASWSLPVAEDSDITTLETGHVLTTASDGTLTARESDTAQPVWRGADSPEELTSAVQTQWGQSEVLVAHAGQNLRIWNLTTPEDQSVVGSSTIDIEHDWRVELNGPAPMVDMGDWIVGVPAAGPSLQQVVVPAGTLPVTATTDSEVITASQSEFLTVTSEGDTTAQVAYTASDGVNSLPTRAWMLDDDHVLLGWDTDDPRLGIYRLSDGHQLTETAVDRLPSQDSQPVTDTTGNTAAFDGIGLTWTSGDATIHVLEGFEITTVNDGLVYGTHRSTGPARINLAGDDPEPRPWPTYSDQAPAPDLVTDQAAYVIADQLDDTILYHSPTTTTQDEQNQQDQQQDNEDPS